MKPKELRAVERYLSKFDIELTAKQKQAFLNKVSGTDIAEIIKGLDKQFGRALNADIVQAFLSRLMDKLDNARSLTQTDLDEALNFNYNEAIPAQPELSSDLFSFVPLSVSASHALPVSLSVDNDRSVMTRSNDGSDDDNNRSIYYSLADSGADFGFEEMPTDNSASHSARYSTQAFMDDMSFYRIGTEYDANALYSSASVPARPNQVRPSAPAQSSAGGSIFDEFNDLRNAHIGGLRQDAAPRRQLDDNDYASVDNGRARPAPAANPVHQAGLFANPGQGANVAALRAQLAQAQQVAALQQQLLQQQAQNIQMQQQLAQGQQPQAQPPVAQAAQAAPVAQAAQANRVTEQRAKQQNPRSVLSPSQRRQPTGKACKNKRLYGAEAQRKALKRVQDQQQKALDYVRQQQEQALRAAGGGRSFRR